MSDQGTKALRRCVRWFVISGSVGLLVAILLWVVGNLDPTRSLFLRLSSILCPMMIVMLADPTTFADKLILGSGVLVSNFVLYGLVGLTLCVLWTLFQRRA